MKEAIQTLLTSDKMAHAFEYLKQDEAHTIDQQIELVQISSHLRRSARSVLKSF